MGVAGVVEWYQWYLYQCGVVEDMVVSDMYSTRVVRSVRHKRREIKRFGTCIIILYFCRWFSVV